MTETDISSSELKKEIRRKMLALRRALSDDEAERKADCLTEQILSLPEYKKAILHKKAHKIWMSGGAFDVAKYLRHHNKSHEPVFIMTDPIIYWLNNQTPISKYIATPSTINKLYLIQNLLQLHCDISQLTVRHNF